MRHRGPDGAGLWRSDCGRVELGHRLLSTVASSGTAQPIVDAEGIVVSANAELYGHDAIRTRLVGLGETPVGASDCAIIGPLHRRLGWGLFPQLRGEFAFLLWDPRAERLLAARDRFGIKPLYHAEHDGVLLFASEIKGLFALGLPPRWDREALAMYQAAHLPPGRTLFEGVHSVPPGHVLECTAAGTRLKRYWSWPRAADTDEDPTPRLRDLLFEAVELRLRSHAQRGFYLSGGLDSTSLLGISRALGHQDQTALTVSFPGSPLDEAAVARRTAAALGRVELLEVRCDAASLAGDFVPSVLASEAPCSNAHGAAKHRLSARARSAGLKVVLTGEGADELFWGYPHLHAPWEGAAPPWMSADADTATWRGLYAFEPSLRPEQAGPTLRRALQELEDGPADGPAASTWLWSRTVLPNYLLRTLGDGVEMAHGVEGRQPFLDHHLAEQVIPLATRWRSGRAQNKMMLRRMVAGFVPPEVLRTPKRPFLSPPVAGPLRRLLLDLVTETAPGISAFDADAVQRLLPSLEAGGVEGDPLLFELASLAVLQRAFDCR